MVDLPFVRVDLERRLVLRPDGGRERLTTVEGNLLAHLLAHQGEVVTRDALLGEVWGYAPTAHSRACDNAIRRLRQKIELDPSDPDCLLTVHGGGYTLVRPTADPTPAPARAQTAPASAGQERGFTVGDRRVDLGRAKVDGPEGPAPLSAKEIGLLEALLAAGGQVVDRDVLLRRVWGSAAGRAIHNTVSRLRRKIEVDPLHPRVLLTTATGYRLELDQADDPPDAGPTPRFDPLPAEIDARFGRRAEIDAILARLTAGDRLVTLVGPGGVGKSRLALAVAVELGSLPLPAVWVELAEARTTDRLAAALAQAVRIQLREGDPFEQLGLALRAHGPAVAVLDNLEQLVPDGVAGVVALLERAPELRVLATSRVALGSRGERRVTVGPLEHPDAIALFVDRSARALDPADPEVDALVAELGAVPLSLELAASRTQVLSLPELRARLTDRLRLLAVADPSRPIRHRSLRACLDASYALLSPASQRAYAQVGVFAGHFDLDAAEAVIDPGGAADGVVDLVQELVDASLIGVQDDPGWFSLAPHVQEHALEQLEPDERARAERRHWRTYARLGQPEALAALDGHHEVEARAALRRQFDNLVRAVDGAIAAGDGASATYAATACWELLAPTGPYGLATAWIEPLLGLPMDDEARARASLLVGRVRYAAGALVDAEAPLTEAVRLAAQLGSAELGAQAHLELVQVRLAIDPIAQVDADAEMALALARTLGNDVLVCRAMCALGRSALARARPAEALDVLTAAGAAARACGARRREVEVRRWLGEALDRGGHLQVADELRRAAQLAVDLGDRRLEAEILCELGTAGAAQHQGWGKVALERALTLFEAVGDRPALASALVSQAIHLINVDAVDLADAALDRAEQIARDSGSVVAMASVTVRRAVVARIRGELDRSDRLLEAVAATGHPKLVRTAGGQRGWNAVARGEFARAREVWAAELAQTDAAGDAFGVTNLEIWLGLATEKFDVEAAIAVWDRAADRARAHGFVSLQVQAVANASGTLAEHGRTAEARERLVQLETIDVSGSPGIAAMRALAIGGVEVYDGPDPERWLAELERISDVHYGGRAFRVYRERFRAEIAARRARDARSR